jgi:hypothetical protein
MSYQLAQLNIARLLHPISDPRLREFVDALEPINAVADRAPGFVWRLKSDSGNATDIHHPWSHDPFLLVNMSVWESPHHLRDYTYRSGHMEFFQRRAEWFEKPSEPHYVLWWIPRAHIPTLEEAQERLDHYRANGATPHAFWFGKLFPSPAIVPACP